MNGELCLTLVQIGIQLCARSISPGLYILNGSDIKYVNSISIKLLFIKKHLGAGSIISEPWFKPRTEYLEFLVCEC